VEIVIFQKNQRVTRRRAQQCLYRHRSGDTLTGPLSDYTLAEILGLVPSMEDLEVAVIYTVGEGDIAGIEGHELAGKPARICEILAADELYQLDDR
jgi:hypothetical protein